MKINMVQKTIEVKYYVADDGTVFQTERECREYEQDFDRDVLIDNACCQAYQLRAEL